MIGADSTEGDLVTLRCYHHIGMRSSERGIESDTPRTVGGDACYYHLIRERSERLAGVVHTVNTVPHYRAGGIEAELTVIIIISAIPRK